MDNKKRSVGAPKGRSRSDLQFKMFVYVSREVDIFIRRLAVKKNQSLSRIVDDIVKKVKKDASNETNVPSSEE